jgi:two-component system KDP operon response regulator KdpE
MPTTLDSILVCDPDPGVQRALGVILGAAGYNVLASGTATEALESARRERPRLVILELTLSDMSGIELCRRLRAIGQMAIVVLSAIDDERVKVEALLSGADDYVTKPFSDDELRARVAARLRLAPSELLLEADGVVIDLAGRTVTIDGTEVRLTATEFALLRALVTSRGAVAYEPLARAVWGRMRGDARARLRTHMSNLRAKLDQDRRRDLIRTEIGVGYRFVRRGDL